MKSGAIFLCLFLVLFGALGCGILDTEPSEIDISEFEDEVWAEVNAARINVGLPALVRDPFMDSMASIHSSDMARWGYFGHFGFEYRCLLIRRGIGASGCGENVAEWYGSPREAVEAWLLSAGHRANIMDLSFRRTGVGAVRNGDAIYVTQLFAD